MSELINAKVIDGFTRSFLAKKYDSPKPIPPFHMEMWDLCCSDNPKVAIAAPRKHAKSTSITLAYILVMVMLRIKSFVLLVSDTEGQASGFLVSIKDELEHNPALRAKFGIKELEKDTETNIICIMNDDHRFRIQAKGSEQKVRGIKWGHQRPDLIVCDDLEGDEQVMNPERRRKFRKWFMNALLPCGSDDCWVRVVGTILHLDAMLNRLLEDPTWESLLFKAHNADWSEILWPEKFSKECLLEIRAGFAAQNNLDGWSQEYLNNPVTTDNAFFNRNYFLDFERDGDKETVWIKDEGTGRMRSPLLPNLEFFAAADFAISERERADYTVIIVGGMSPEGILHIVDVKRFRGDSDEIIEELLATQKMWGINTFTFETEKIDKALGPSLNRAMQRKNIWLNIHKETPTKSKTMRAASIRAMHKSGSIRYDKKALWYPDFSTELSMVGDSGPRGKHDDMFDSFAYLGLTIDQFWDAMSDEELEEEEWEEAYDEYHDQGRSHVTGY